MASFADLVANLNLNIQGFSSAMRQASAMTSKFAADLNGQLNNGFAEPVKKAKFEFKDVARIVQGILISKVFYGAMNAIRNATSATLDFSNSLEYAHTTYKTLFGDASLASEFINVLKDYAAFTPFTFTQAEDAAQRLLAYGVKGESIMYVMQGIMASSAIQNSPQVMESVSRAIGQIYTKGRLMNEEMRQLTEAGIPAYEILKDKLGLTQEQLQNLKKTAVPASVAINALIDGMTERFGGLVQETAKTLPGIIGNLKDNSLMIAAAIIEPAREGFKNLLEPFGEMLQGLRMLVETQGVGGLFEALIPPGLQSSIRTIIAGIMTLWEALLRLRASLAPLNALLNQAFFQVLAMAIPVITGVVNVLAGLTYTFLNNEGALRFLVATLAAAATAWAIFRAQALATIAIKSLIGVITGVGKAVAFLGASLVAHPIITIFALLAASLVFVALSSSEAGKSIGDLFKQLTSFQGVDPDKILLPSQKERTADLDKFNKKLSGTGEAMDDLADSTGKAAKAAKNLLSFDEVFKLTTPDEGAGAGIGGALEELLGGLTIPEIEIPSFEDFASGFVDNLFGSIKDRLASAGIGAGIGAILGGIIGGVLGNPLLGAKIGALAGGIVGFLWEEIKAALNMSDKELLSSLLATALGAIIGGVLGGPGGAIIGAAIATLMAGLGRLLWAKLAEIFGTGPGSVETAHIGSLLGAAIGAVLGGILAGPGGAVIGAAIGFLAGGVVGLFWEQLKEKFSFSDIEGLSTIIGAAIGAAIGGVMAGPPGAAIGGAIGALVGWVIGQFYTGFTTGEWNITAISLPLGTLIGAGIGMIVAGPPGAAIGAAIGLVVGWVVDKFIDGFSTGNWDVKGIALPLGTLIGGGIGMLIAGPPGAAIGAAIGLVVTWIGEGLVRGFKEIGPYFVEHATKNFLETLSTLWGAVADLFSWEEDASFLEIGKSVVLGIIGGIGAAALTILAALWDFLVAPIIDGIKFLFGIHSPATTMMPIGEQLPAGILVGVSTGVTALLEGIAGFAPSIFTSFTSWTSGIAEEFTTWSTGVATDFATWGTATSTSLGTWVTDTSKSVSDWALGTKGSFTTWVTETGTSISKWVSDRITGFSSFSTDSTSSINTFATNSKFDISSFITTTGIGISTWASEAYKKIETWAKDSGTKVGTFTSLATDFTTFCDNTFTTISTWASDLWKSISDTFTKATELISGFFKSFSNQKVSVETNAEAKTYTRTIRTATESGVVITTGHADGGVFNREHVARFNEGNKAEAIIPLENDRAMQPFVDAVSNGVTMALAPFLAGAGNQSGTADVRQILYVGTLIADDRGLQELNTKLNIIQLQEDDRRGLPVRV